MLNGNIILIATTFVNSKVFQSTKTFKFFDRLRSKIVPFNNIPLSSSLILLQQRLEKLNQQISLSSDSEVLISEYESIDKMIIKVIETSQNSIDSIISIEPKINIINYEEINHPRLYKENRHFDIHSPQLVNENYFPDINPPQLVKENSLLDINPPQLIKENSLLDVNPPQLKKEKSYNFEFDLGRCEDADIPVPHQY